jgi:DNA-binding NarL/FixJ family response regulator
VSSHAEARFVARALYLGASGYLLKSSSAEALRSAIREAARGQLFLDEQLPQRTIFELVERMRADVGRPLLTDRQKEVLALVADGKSTKEVAALLGISAKTIEAHRAQLMQRLGIRDLAALVQYAIDECIVPKKPRYLGVMRDSDDGASKEQSH